MSVGGRNQGAHQYGIMGATSKPEPFSCPINKIASNGFPLANYDNEEKVQRMRKKIQAGGELPPVRLSKLTPELRDKYGVTDPTKTHYLENGHHRLAAQM